MQVQAGNRTLIYGADLSTVTDWLTVYAVCFYLPGLTRVSPLGSCTHPGFDSLVSATEPPHACTYTVPIKTIQDVEMSRC
jgi:hypothetical protein